jgi:MFS family permease
MQGGMAGKTPSLFSPLRIETLLTCDSAFFLTLAAFVSAWGKAYKYFSLRLTYILAIIIFEAGSLLCALSPASAALIIGRAIQGLGAAGLAGGGYTITAFVIPMATQPVVVGLMGSVFTVASVLGPLLGGFFTSDVTWRWCFYINLPIGGVTILCMLIFFRTPAHAKGSHGAPWQEILLGFDPLGLVLMFSGVLCLFLVLPWGGVSESWSSAKVVGLLVGCVTLLGLFVLNEWYQGDRALIVFRILCSRSIGGCSGYIFL